MVTRKTRLLSAFAALLMLVSMFTCVALPAVAETITLDANAPVAWPDAWVQNAENIIPYSERANHATQTNYAIDSAADWIAAVNDSRKAENPEQFGTIDLWFTKDIDFNGQEIASLGGGTQKVTVTDAENGYSSTSMVCQFKGKIYGQNHVIKNLNLKEHFVGESYTYLKDGKETTGYAYSYGGLIGYAGNVTSTDFACIRDLGIASGTVTFTGDKLSTGQYGVFVGASNSYARVMNCWNAADLSYTAMGETAADQTSREQDISIFGRLSARQTVLANCYNYGDITATALNVSDTFLRVSSLCDWTYGSTTAGRNQYVVNCFSSGELNKTCNGAVNTTYLLNFNGTEIKDGRVTNLYGYGPTDVSNKSPGSYTTVLAPTNPIKLIKKETVASGELAWNLNKNYSTQCDSWSGRRYFTVKDGLTVHGTQAEQPIKVNFIFGGETTTAYGVPDANGKVNMAALYPMEGAIYEASAGTVDGNTLTATPGSEVNVTVTSSVLIYTYLQEAVDYFNARNIAYYKDANGVALTSEQVGNIQNKITAKDYDNQAEINADLATLNGYTFDKDSVVSMGEFALYSDVATKYTVGSKQEMEKLFEVYADVTEGTVIYITANIDMEGSDATRLNGLYEFKGSIDGGNKIISNLYVHTAFLPSYKGAYVKDLTFKNCNALATANNGAWLVDICEEDLTISNVTLDGVTAKSVYSSSSGGMQGLLVCQLNDAKLTIEDVDIINSKMIRPDGTEYWNSGLILGKTYKGTLTIDGVYLNNNTIEGARTASGTGIAIGEIICDATVKNILVLNTTANDRYQNGIFSLVKEGYASTSPLAPQITIENVIAYNNGETVNGIRTAKTDGSTTIKNVYLDTTNVVSDAGAQGVSYTDCVASAAEAITSGEAAWALNKALAGDKWTMVNGLPAFGDEDDQTVRVSLEMEGFDPEYLYADLNEELTLEHSVPNCTFALKNSADSSFATVSGDKLTVTGVPTENLTISIVAATGTLYFDALDDKIDEIGDKAAFYIDSEGTKTVADDLAIIKARREADYEGYTQKQIQDDLALLESYTLTEVDADSKATLEVAEADLGAFGEQISYFAQADAMTEALLKINAALADTEAADGLEAKTINTAMAEAVTAYNAIGTRTIATGKVVPMRYFNLFKSYTKDWTVADETDWRTAVEKVTQDNSKSMTITLIDDIDMTADNDDSSVLPLVYKAYFNGVLDGQGHVFKNLKIDTTVTVDTKEYAWIGLVCTVGATGVIKNVGIESGSIALHYSSTANARVGSIAGSAAGGSVIQNCWNAASVTLTLDGGNSDSYVGGIVGSATVGSTVDGCYNIGAVTSDGKQAAGINGWGQTDLTSKSSHGRVYNSFNYGTVAANGGYVGAVRLGGGYRGGIANSYAIGTDLAFVSTPYENMSATQQAVYNYNNEGNSNLPAEIYSTGELAWKLNSGWADNYSNHTNEAYAESEYANFLNYEEIHPYYTLEDGKTVFGTNQNQTLRITVKYDGMEAYFYANADAADIALGTEGTYTVESGSAEVKTGNMLDITGTEDVVLVIATDPHTHNLEYTNNNDGTHTPYCTFSATVDGRIFECDYEGETVACSNLTYKVVESSIDAESHAHQSIATCEDCDYVAAAADCAAGYSEEISTQPDCVSKGEKTFTCKNTCGYSYTEEINEKGHDKDYTSADNNQHTIICRNCSAYTETVPCEPDENGWQVTLPPSVEAVGTKETTCILCSGTVTAEIDKLAAVTVKAGLDAEETEVTATVGLQNNPGVATVTVEVAFDYTVMDLKEVTGLNGMTAGTPAVENGVVTFTVTAATEFTNDTADIATVVFTMKTEDGNLIASNKDYELKVTAEAKNGADEPVALEDDEAISTVTKGNAMVKGDLTGDAEVNLADAILLLRYVSGGELPEAYRGLITDDMADLTDEGDGVDLGDGQIVPEVNTNDVIYLLRYLNGWTDTL